MRPPSAARFFWKLAIVVLLIGGGISYLLWARISGPDSRSLFSGVLFATILITGLCVICATANLWLKR